MFCGACTISATAHLALRYARFTGTWCDGEPDGDAHTAKNARRFCQCQHLHLWTGHASVQWIATRKLWRCKECKRQFTAKVGTIFEDSPIGFDKWLAAFWLLSANRNGISSLELSRSLGVT